MATLTLLPLDLTGNALTNRRVGEVHYLTQVPNRTNRVTVLAHGGFYTDNLVVYDKNNVVLRRDVDYVPTYLYKILTDLTAKEVMGMLVITNPNVQSPIKVDYRAVGGPFSLDVEELRELMLAVQDGNFTVSFEDIIGKPAQYNPAEHPTELWTTYGWDTTIAEIGRISDAVTAGNSGLMNAAEDYANKILDSCQDAIAGFADAAQAHYNDYDDPHITTPTQVGLGNLNNWPMASLLEAQNANITNRYLAPAYAYQALDGKYGADLRAHLQDYNNPHEDTAADVGAYTKPVIDGKLALLLDRNGVAANSAAWAGYNFTDATNFIRWAMDAANLISGIFPPARIGAGTTGADKLLTGGTNGFPIWRSIADIFATYDKNASSVVVAIGYQGTSAQATAYLNTYFTDINAYPIGSWAVLRSMVTFGGGGGNGGRTDNYYETNVAQRTGSGWVIFTL